LNFSAISPQPNGVEPFSPLSRHTAIELRSLESASLRTGEEKEKDEAPILRFPVDVRRRKAQSQYPLGTVQFPVRLSVRFQTTDYLEFEKFERIGESSTEAIPRQKGPPYETGSHNEGSRP
jgi:hypothetical protein